MRDFYLSKEYLQRNPTWHVEDSAWKAHKVLALLKKHKVVPRTICEIGCGAGEILAELHRQMPPTTVFRGYEVSPHAYELCMSRARDRLEFVLGDFALLGDRVYDLALVLDVLEHVDDCSAFLRGVKANAQQVVFHIPLDLSVSAVLREAPLLRARRGSGHVHFFTKQLALEVLTESGFSVIDCELTSGAIELPARGMGAKLMYVPRKAASAVNCEWAARVLGGFSLLVLAT